MTKICEITVRRPVETLLLCFGYSLLRTSGFLKGLGVAQVCKVGDDAWQKQVFHHLFFQHFGTFRLATCVIWACFSIFPWHLLCQDQAVQGFADTSSAQEWFDQGGLCSGGCWLTQAGDDDNDDGRCVCLGEVMTTPMPCKWTLDALWIQDFVCFEILATLIKPGAWCWPNQIWSFRSSYGTTLLYDIQHFVRLVNPSFSDSMNLYRSTMES